MSHVATKIMTKVIERPFHSLLMYVSDYSICSLHKQTFNSFQNSCYSRLPIGMASNCAIRGYYIRSKMNNYVLDVKNNEKNGGTPVIAFPMKTGENEDPSNQLWVFEEDGTIKSVASGLVMDIRGGIGGTDLIVWQKKNEGNEANQKWTWDPPYICCEAANKVLEIEGAKNEPRAKVIAHAKNGGLHQQWRLVPTCKCKR